MPTRAAWLSAGHDEVLSRSSLSLLKKCWQCFSLSTEDLWHRVGRVETVWWLLEGLRHAWDYSRPPNKCISYYSPGHRVEPKASKKDQSISGGGSRAVNQGHYFDKHQGPVYCQSIPWSLGNNRIKRVCFQGGCPGHLPMLKRLVLATFIFGGWVGYIYTKEETHTCLFCPLLDLI